MYPPHPRFPSPPSLPSLTCALLLLLAVAGCGTDATVPPADPRATGGAMGSGELDPGQDTFELEAGTTAPDGFGYVPVQLLGRNLEVLADSNQVSLEVAIHNPGSQPLYAPGAVYLSRFEPGDVFPLDADAVIAPAWSEGPLGEIEYRYDYRAEFGGDGILDPGETSRYRTWTFLVPTLGPFSFAARTEFGLTPAEPRIAGTAFIDRDADGFYGEGDSPLMMGVVIVITPDGERIDHWFESEQGHYSFPITSTGLYTLHLDPLIDSFVPWVFTTPYPRRVLITPDGDGAPQSYGGADFGLTWSIRPGPEPIGFSSAPVDSLHRMPWSFIEMELATPTILRIRVGHSGCDAEQPVSLWMSGGFMESEPVQADVVFVNESLDVCDGWFENDYRFDLTPMLGSYLAAYGPGTLRMNLVDYQGDVHVLTIPIDPED